MSPGLFSSGWSLLTCKKQESWFWGLLLSFWCLLYFYSLLLSFCWELIFAFWLKWIFACVLIVPSFTASNFLCFPICSLTTLKFHPHVFNSSDPLSMTPFFGEQKTTLHASGRFHPSMKCRLPPDPGAKWNRHTNSQPSGFQFGSNLSWVESKVSVNAVLNGNRKYKVHCETVKSSKVYGVYSLRGIILLKFYIFVTFYCLLLFLLSFVVVL